MKKHKNFAFTMAEVLLVLAILGITATLTIPNLSKNVDEEKYIAGLKTVIGQINTAVQAIMSEYDSMSDVTSSCSGHTDAYCLGEELVKKMNVVKDCQGTVTPCVPKSPLYEANYPNFNYVVTDNEAAGCGYAFILKSGTSVCIRPGGTYYFDNNLNNLLLNVEVDIDGPTKGPNTRGMDCFELRVGENGVTYTNAYGSQNVANDLYAVPATKGSFDFEYELAEWVMTVGNMDYLRCKASNLNWNTKRTCP